MGAFSIVHDKLCVDDPGSYLEAPRVNITV